MLMDCVLHIWKKIVIISQNECCVLLQNLASGVSSVTVEFLLLNSSSCPIQSLFPLPVGRGTISSSSSCLLCSCRKSQDVCTCVWTLVSLPLLLPFITWLDRSWHVGRRRHLNAGNWQAIAAPGPRRCSFFLPFRSFIISYTTAGGWWLSEDFVMNTPPAESLWDGLANQEMVGRSASLTDRKWCN